MLVKVRSHLTNIQIILIQIDSIALLADKHFTIPGYNFSNNANFAFIEMRTNTKQVTTKTRKEKLKNCERRWIRNLKILKSDAFNL